MSPCLRIVLRIVYSTFRHIRVSLSFSFPVPFVVSFIVSPFRYHPVFRPALLAVFGGSLCSPLYVPLFRSVSSSRLALPLSPRPAFLPALLTCRPTYPTLISPSLACCLSPTRMLDVFRSPRPAYLPALLADRRGEGQADWCAVENYSEVGRYVFPDLGGLSLLIRDCFRAIFL